MTLRITEILPHGRWPMSEVTDRVRLDHDARHRRRFTHRTEGGITVLIDLPRAVVLEDGDGLRLADGRIVAVEAAQEPLMEVTAPDAAALMRLAWHVGNRHLPCDIRPDRLRLREDHVIAAMLEGLGATVTRLEAAFSPESGAYAGGGHAHHDHDHGHSHDHGHDHHHEPHG